MIVADLQLKSCLGGLVRRSYNFQATAEGLGGPNMQHSWHIKDAVLHVLCGIVVKRLETTEDKEEDEELEDSEYNDDEYYNDEDNNDEDNKYNNQDVEYKNDQDNQDNNNIPTQKSNHTEFVNTGVKAPDGMYHWSQENDDDKECCRRLLLRWHPPPNAPQKLCLTLTPPTCLSLL